MKSKTYFIPIEMFKEIGFFGGFVNHVIKLKNSLN